MGARNPDAVRVWADGFIYYSLLATRPALPTDIDTALGVTWLSVGLLDGDDGIAQKRDIDSKPFFAWGAGQVAESNKNPQVTGSFSPLQDDADVNALVNPGMTSSKVPMPRPIYAWLAFQTSSQFAYKERRFTTRKAKIWTPEDNRNESDITKWKIEFTLFADGNGDMFDRQVAA